MIRNLLVVLLVSFSSPLWSATSEEVVQVMTDMDASLTTVSEMVTAADTTGALALEAGKFLGLVKQAEVVTPDGLDADQQARYVDLFKQIQVQAELVVSASAAGDFATANLALKQIKKLKMTGHAEFR